MWEAFSCCLLCDMTKITMLAITSSMLDCKLMLTAGWIVWLVPSAGCGTTGYLFTVGWIDRPFKIVIPSEFPLEILGIIR